MLFGGWRGRINTGEHIILCRLPWSQQQQQSQHQKQLSTTEESRHHQSSLLHGVSCLRREHSSGGGGRRRTTPTTAAAALATVQSRPDRDDFVVGRANSQRWTSRGLFDGSSSTGRWARLDFFYTIYENSTSETYMYPILTTTYRKNTQSYWRNPGVETVVENLRRLCSTSM